MFRITNSLVRKAFTSFKPVRTLCTPRYGFANTGRSTPPPITPKEVKKPALKEQVESEIKFEKENTPDNAELLETVTKDGWTVNSKGMFHELTKKIGDKTVNITFLSRSPSSAPENEEGENNEEEQGPNDFLEFTVYVRKGNNPQALYSDFIVAGGEVTLGALNFTGDYESHKTQSKFERSQSLYQGPDLETLDETLVESLTNYFEGLGLNENVINFVEQYSLNTEHTFYVKWL